MNWYDDITLFENIDINKSHNDLRRLLLYYKNDKGEVDFKRFCNDSVLFTTDLMRQMREELDEYFEKSESILNKNKLKKAPGDSFIDYQKFSMDVKNKILIRLVDEPRGDSEKVWVDIGYGSFLHRVNKLEKDGARYTGFTEMVVNKLASQVDIECADYDLSVDEDGRPGVISYNVLDRENLKNPELFNLQHIFQIMNYRKEENQDGYYIEDALKLIDGYCLMYKIEPDVRDNLIFGFLKNVVFDLAICQTDRHEENTNFIYGIDKDGKKILKNAPLIDNELALGAEKSYKFMEEMVKKGNINPEEYKNIDDDFTSKVTTEHIKLSKQDQEGAKQLQEHINAGGKIMDFLKKRMEERGDKPYEQAEIYDNQSIQSVLDYIDEYLDMTGNEKVKEMFNEWVAYELPNLDIYSAIEDAEKEVGGTFKVDEVYKQYTAAVFDERFYNKIDPYIEKKIQEIEEIDDIGDIEDPDSPGGDL